MSKPKRRCCRRRLSCSRSPRGPGLRGSAGPLDRNVPEKAAARARRRITRDDRPRRAGVADLRIWPPRRKKAGTFEWAFVVLRAELSTAGGKKNRQALRRPELGGGTRADGPAKIVGAVKERAGTRRRRTPIPLAADFRESLSGRKEPLRAGSERSARANRLGRRGAPRVASRPKGPGDGKRWARSPYTATIILRSRLAGRGPTAVRAPVTSSSTGYVVFVARRRVPSTGRLDRAPRRRARRARPAAGSVLHG